MSAEKRLNVRLAKAEHDALAELARASGLTMSDFVRRRCLEDDGRPRIVVDTEVLKAIYRDQRRIGGLLNQLMRHVNAHRQEFPQLAEQTHSLLRQLEKTAAEVSALISEAKRSA